MPLDADDLMKIQGLLSPLISRTEYEPRHVDLERQVAQNKQDIANLIVMERADRDRFLAALQSLNQKIDDKVGEVGKQGDDIKASLASLRTEIYQRSAEGGNVTLRYIVSVVVSFVIGIVMFLVGFIATKWH